MNTPVSSDSCDLEFGDLVRLARQNPLRISDEEIVQIVESGAREKIQQRMITIQ